MKITKDLVTKMKMVRIFHIILEFKSNIQHWGFTSKRTEYTAGIRTIVCRRETSLFIGGRSINTLRR